MLIDRGIAEIDGLLGNVHVDERCALLSVLLAGQTGQRDISESCVRHILRAVSVGQLEGLRQQVDVLRRVDFHGGDIKVLKDIQDLDQVRATG